MAIAAITAPSRNGTGTEPVTPSMTTRRATAPRRSRVERSRPHRRGSELEPLIPGLGKMGRPRRTDLEAGLGRDPVHAGLWMPVVPAILLSSPFSTVRNHFHAWRDGGVLDRMMEIPYGMARVCSGRSPGWVGVGGCRRASRASRSPVKWSIGLAVVQFRKRNPDFVRKIECIASRHLHQGLPCTRTLGTDRRISEQDFPEPRGNYRPMADGAVMRIRIEHAQSSGHGAFRWPFLRPGIMRMTEYGTGNPVVVRYTFRDFGREIPVYPISTVKRATSPGKTGFAIHLMPEPPLSLGSCHRLASSAVMTPRSSARPLSRPTAG